MIMRPPYIYHNITSPNLDISLTNMEFGGNQSYYGVLGVRPGCSTKDVRSAYRKLAMKWHPDRWAKDPVLAEEAKWRFQSIQQAYEVLSDHRKRTLYDIGMYEEDNDVEDVEGFAGFVQEMVDLMANVRKEEKGSNLEELREMLKEVGRDMNMPAFGSGCSEFESRDPKRRKQGMVS